MSLFYCGVLSFPLFLLCVKCGVYMAYPFCSVLCFNTSGVDFVPLFYNIYVLTLCDMSLICVKCLQCVFLPCVYILQCPMYCVYFVSFILQACLECLVCGVYMASTFCSVKCLLKFGVNFVSQFYSIYSLVCVVCILCL